MINLGRPHVKVLSDGWTAVTRDRSLSAQYEHTIGVTATGCEIFTLSPKGLDRPGLPHSARRDRPSRLFTKTGIHFSTRPVCLAPSIGCAHGPGWRRAWRRQHDERGFLAEQPMRRSRTAKQAAQGKAALSWPSRPPARTVCRMPAEMRLPTTSCSSCCFSG